MVTRAQDKDPYGTSESFLRLVGHDPGVSSVVFPTGGHNHRTCAAHLPSSLEWLFRHRS